MLFIATTNDLVKPKYRGDDLRIKEFAVDYNNTVKVIYNSSDSSGILDYIRFMKIWDAE